MPPVTVFGKPGCVQCEYTEKRLTAEGVPFKTVDVMADDDGYSRVQASGKTQLPMVIAGEDVWHGFRPDKIKALVA